MVHSTDVQPVPIADLVPELDHLAVVLLMSTPARTADEHRRHSKRRWARDFAPGWNGRGTSVCVSRISPWALAAASPCAASRILGHSYAPGAETSRRDRKALAPPCRPGRGDSRRSKA